VSVLEESLEINLRPLRLVTLVVKLLFVAHLLACGWFAVGKVGLSPPAPAAKPASMKTVDADAGPMKSVDADAVGPDDGASGATWGIHATARTHGTPPLHPTGPHPEEGKGYPRCGSNAWDPTGPHPEEGKGYPRCGSNAWDPTGTPPRGGQGVPTRRLECSTRGVLLPLCSGSNPAQQAIVDACA
jgi:hypothetical protein